MRPAQIASSLFLISVAAVPCLAQPTAEQIFKQYVPVQRGVDFDTPEADKFKDCKVEIERGEGTAGFVVYGPAGEVLRRFTDTNNGASGQNFHLNFAVRQIRHILGELFQHDDFVSFGRDHRLNADLDRGECGRR